jgi:quercetin dioxygenase-like cupin family protein
MERRHPAGPRAGSDHRKAHKKEIAMAGSSLRAPKTTHDPVTVDSKHYSVLVDNEQVRILQINYGAHEKSPMHSHPDAVAVFLADQRARFTFPDGKSLERDMGSGQVLWMPAETHAPENLSDGPLRLILVEMKSGGTTATSRPPGSQDPITVDSKHNNVVIDNDRVRVYRTIYGPGEKSEMHGHPNYAAVFLTDSQIKFGSPDGKTETVNFKAGEASWQEAHAHTTENTGTQTCEVIIIEMKPKAGPRRMK